MCSSDGVVVLLSCDLDELLEQLHSLVERHTHEHLRHDPLLDLIAALEEDRERRCVARTRSTAEGVVHQLLLRGGRGERVSDGHCHKKEIQVTFGRHLQIALLANTPLYSGFQTGIKRCSHFRNQEQR